MRPSSTVMSPGPTCFQPVKSLPLKSCFHAGVCARAATKSKAVLTTQVRQIPTLRTMLPPPMLSRPQLEAQGGQIDVADLDVLEWRFRVIILDKIMLNAAFVGLRENPLEVDRPLADIGEAPLKFHRAGRSGVAARSVRIVHIVLYVHQREAPRILVE